MAIKVNQTQLSEEFIKDLFKTCMLDIDVLDMVCTYMRPQDFPDRAMVKLFRLMQRFYESKKTMPPYSVLIEMAADSVEVMALLRDINKGSRVIKRDLCAQMAESYIKKIKFVETYRECGRKFNAGDMNASIKILNEYVEWEQNFSLCATDLYDVPGNFMNLHNENKLENQKKKEEKRVNKFYIDEIDALNNGRDLRGQLSYILAATGVGKSHAARWIGRNGYLDGLNILHFQLEGSRKEVANAYSASLAQCNSYGYEQGRLNENYVARVAEELSLRKGKLLVKSFPKFNTSVSTMNIKNGIAEFKQKMKAKPDLIIVDSADLLTDSSGIRYDDKGERHKRVRVANDLKDLAADENVWIVATYQSTVEDPIWLNNPKNVFTEYNTSEAKGLSRPLTHLITLNQTENEYKDHKMRINIAKSRFFKKCAPFTITTDYDNEVFCVGQGIKAEYNKIDCNHGFGGFGEGSANRRTGL